MSNYVNSQRVILDFDDGSDVSDIGFDSDNESNA